MQDLKIERTIRHPDYDRYKKLNDIALIKLEMPAKLSQNNIKTICLPIEAVDDVERTAKLPKPLPMTISGFGRLGNGAREPSNVLQKAFVPFVNIDECQKLYTARKSKDILQKQFCAGGKNATDTCSGDSGEFNCCFNCSINIFGISRRSNNKFREQRKNYGLWSSAWRHRV